MILYLLSLKRFLGKENGKNWLKVYLFHIGSKWAANSLRLPIRSMIAPNKLLRKIILTNLWPISRHTKLTIEKTQFM